MYDFFNLKGSGFIENIKTEIIEHSFVGTESFQVLMQFEIDRKIEELLKERLEESGDMWYNENK